MENIGYMRKGEGVLDLRDLLSQFEEDLFERYLPFHHNFVIDSDAGGFQCAVRPDGSRVSDEKVTWYQGRGMWVYSFLYNHFGSEQKYLDVALQTWSLLQRSYPVDVESFWPKTLHRDGSAASPPDEEIYGDLFIAEGLAELSQATRDASLWDSAKTIVLKCIRRYDREDYFPRIGETYLGSGAPPFAGARILGVWMVLIRTLTQMLTMREDQELENLIDRSVATVLQHHLNPRFNLLNELLNHDLSTPENDYEQLVYVGHAIETLWMILDEGKRRKDAALLATVAQLFRRHVEVAEDRVYGGLFRNLKNVNQNHWTLDKTLFPHQEAMLGTMLLWERFDDPWARECFEKLYKYTRSRFPMTSLHSPLWQVTADRFVTINSQQTRAENYHHPRFLMLSILALRRMLGGIGGNEEHQRP
jgi:N-acylglucosamine 2-epimerase